jgi:hypothetical protein
MTKRLRKQKLIKTSLQLRMSLVFLTLAFIAALFQVILLNRSIMRLSDQMATDGDTLLSELPSLLATNLVLTMVILVPVMIGVGIIVTHRIEGPVYRFETNLAQIARGEDVGSCRLRDGDELKELCDRINEAVSALRHETSGAEVEQAVRPHATTTRDAA